MSKLFTALCVLLLFSAKLPAQEINKNFCRQFGIILGMNASQMKYTKKASPLPLTTKGIIGPAIGAFLTISLHKKFRLQQQYLLSVLGSKINNDTTYRLNYFSLPLLVQYNVFKRVWLLAGGNFDILLRANEKAGTTNNITEEVETRDIGITGGLELQLTPALSIAARYMQGLNDVDEISRRREFQNQNLQLAVLLHL